MCIQDVWYENLLPKRIQYKYSSVELEKVCVFSTLQTNLSYFDNGCSHAIFYFTLISALLVCIVFIYYYPTKLFSCKSGWVQIFRVLWATKCYLGSVCSYSILTLFLKFASPCYPIFPSLRIFENNISSLSESECADFCLVHPNNKYHFKFLLIFYTFHLIFRLRFSMQICSTCALKLNTCLPVLISLFITFTLKLAG